MGRSSRPGVLRLRLRHALELWWPVGLRERVQFIQVVDDHSSCSTVLCFPQITAVSRQRRQEGMCQRHWRQGDRGCDAGVGAAPLTVSDSSMGVGTRLTRLPAACMRLPQNDCRCALQPTRTSAIERRALLQDIAGCGKQACEQNSTYRLAVLRLRLCLLARMRRHAVSSAKTPNSVDLTARMLQKTTAVLSPDGVPHA
jgi:hypothetical protein